MKNTDVIFLDLDETLISSVYCSTKSFASDYIAQYIEFDSCCFMLPDGVGWYVSFLRPTTFKLLNFCENLVGPENVYILTAATQEYAEAIVDKLGISISKDKIYSREHIAYAKYVGKVDKFKDVNSILIDNLYYRDHRKNPKIPTKGEFLYDLPPKKYVHIIPFNIDTTWSGTWKKDAEDFEELKTRIVSALLYEHKTDNTGSE